MKKTLIFIVSVLFMLSCLAPTSVAMGAEVVMYWEKSPDNTFLALIVEPTISPYVYRLTGAEIGDPRLPWSPVFGTGAVNGNIVRLSFIDGDSIYKATLDVNTLNGIWEEGAGSGGTLTFRSDIQSPDE